MPGAETVRDGRIQRLHLSGRHNAAVFQHRVPKADQVVGQTERRQRVGVAHVLGPNARSPSVGFLHVGPAGLAAFAVVDFVEDRAVVLVDRVSR